MAWNVPALFAAGSTLAASQMNQIRDSLKALGDPWTPWTPTWNVVGNTATLGNATLTGAYILTGKRLEFRINMTMGSTTTYGSGSAMTLTLPFSLQGDNSFSGQIYDTSGSAYRRITGTQSSPSMMVLYCDPTTAGSNLRIVNNTVPFTWATGDTITIGGSAEIV